MMDLADAWVAVIFEAGFAAEERHLRWPDIFMKKDYLMSKLHEQRQAGRICSYYAERLSGLIVRSIPDLRSCIRETSAPSCTR